MRDFSNWKKEDLLKAREKDITTMENLTSRNAQLAEFLKEEMKNYRGGGTFQGSYAFFESSHEEQREYIEKAVAALPEALKEEAQKELNRLDVQRQEKYEAASWDGKKSIHMKNSDPGLEGFFRRKRRTLLSGERWERLA